MPPHPTDICTALEISHSLIPPLIATIIDCLAYTAHSNLINLSIIDSTTTRIQQARSTRLSFTSQSDLDLVFDPCEIVIRANLPVLGYCGRRLLRGLIWHAYMEMRRRGLDGLEPRSRWRGRAARLNEEIVRMRVGVVEVEGDGEVLGRSSNNTESQSTEEVDAEMDEEQGDKSLDGEVDGAGFQDCQDSSGTINANGALDTSSLGGSAGTNESMSTTVHDDTSVASHNDKTWSQTSSPTLLGPSRSPSPSFMFTETPQNSLHPILIADARPSSRFESHGRSSAVESPSSETLAHSPVLSNEHVSYGQCCQCSCHGASSSSLHVGGDQSGSESMSEEGGQFDSDIDGERDNRFRQDSSSRHRDPTTDADEVRWGDRSLRNKDPTTDADGIRWGDRSLRNKDPTTNADEIRWEDRSLRKNPTTDADKLDGGIVPCVKT
ncbi:hypothetical protein K402DRAFT_253054 [Aulographum hederae CBS 113979]|uniref:Uncharacterized protein n=1 Tax=Aulographum hederae CBS 113979 TaxID=1176131 RepID=A0A6G1GJK3_9PEZI|nr:hypothetical protein K402DRAFT_253054 [Aulographum hederae CBS 113979]